jgi:hypothetical protein
MILNILKLVVSHFELLWKCKKEIIFMWVFFFFLSHIGETPHSTTKLIIISFVTSLFLTNVLIILIKMGILYKRD